MRSSIILPVLATAHIAASAPVSVPKNGNPGDKPHFNSDLWGFNELGEVETDTNNDNSTDVTVQRFIGSHRPVLPLKNKRGEKEEEEYHVLNSTVGDWDSASQAKVVEVLPNGNVRVDFDGDRKPDVTTASFQATKLMVPNDQKVVIPIWRRDENTTQGGETGTEDSRKRQYLTFYTPTCVGCSFQELTIYGYCLNRTETCVRFPGEKDSDFN